jgi:hypothetical protein
MTSAKLIAHRRAWQDLSQGRLLLGLAAAPLLPVALGALLVTIVESRGGGLVTGVAAIVAVAEIWSLVAGTAYLFVARLRGGIRRVDCLLLGAVIAFSLPFAVRFASAIIDWMMGAAAPASEDDWFVMESPSISTFVLVGALMMLPFGALGGWVFWRVGVRPARPKVVDVARVFDCCR